MLTRLPDARGGLKQSRPLGFRDGVSLEHIVEDQTRDDHLVVYRR
jgi:hypothetical protein